MWSNCFPPSSQYIGVSGLFTANWRRSWMGTGGLGGGGYLSRCDNIQTPVYTPSYSQQKYIFSKSVGALRTPTSTYKYKKIIKKTKKSPRNPKKKSQRSPTNYTEKSNKLHQELQKNVFEKSKFWEIWKLFSQIWFLFRKHNFNKNLTWTLQRVTCIFIFMLFQAV